MSSLPLSAEEDSEMVAVAHLASARSQETGTGILGINKTNKREKQPLFGCFLYMHRTAVGK